MSDFRMRSEGDAESSSLEHAVAAKIIIFPELSKLCNIKFKRRQPILTAFFCLVAQAGCCSEGCENCCGDARYELHDPLEGFLLRHTSPPSLYVYHLSFIIYHF